MTIYITVEMKIIRIPLGQKEALYMKERTHHANMKALYLVVFKDPIILTILKA